MISHAQEISVLDDEVQPLPCGDISISCQMAADSFTQTGPFSCPLLIPLIFFFFMWS